MATKAKFSLVFPVSSAIFLVMLLKFASTILAADDKVVIKETKMTVYLHDYAGGPNATSLPMFGTLFVSDDLITQGPELTSPMLGRGQGIYMPMSLDGVNAYVSFSLVFTNKAYNGSTIQVQGNSNQLFAVSEYGVVSGTGKFRYATGYITFETLSFDPSTFYSLIRANVSVRHD
ncbi:hypothetical protein ES288_D02G031400v1 [Gossypium darwinii]|uniref:Dirigent protein n=1 Tax=Gossypium darwinii TaxID=34276 RepID=A0A5D2DBS6_GOSDA|nr:hypothetical protein ES288_D02G031400v1 [Gossypium darwinii]